MILVKFICSSIGLEARRNLAGVPRVGDSVVIECDYYIVRRVIWQVEDIIDTVTVVVDVFEEGGL